MTDLASRTEWALQLTGDFEFPCQTFRANCADEWTARRRAAWWRWWRPDVHVVLQARVDGRWVEVEW